MLKLASLIDLRGYGRLSLEEVLAAVLESAGKLTESRLREAFEAIDSGGDGRITLQELILVQQRFGMAYNPKLLVDFMDRWHGSCSWPQFRYVSQCCNLFVPYSPPSSGA